MILVQVGSWNFSNSHPIHAHAFSEKYTYSDNSCISHMKIASHKCML